MIFDNLDFTSLATTVNSPKESLSDETDNFIRDLDLSIRVQIGSIMSEGRYCLDKATASFTLFKVFILFEFSLSVNIIINLPGVMVVSVLSIPLRLLIASSISRTAILSIFAALAPA